MNKSMIDLIFANACSRSGRAGWLLFMLVTAGFHAQSAAQCVASAADCEVIAQVKSVWAEFISCLLAEDSERALALVSPAAHTMFKPVLFAPGARPSDFARSVEKFFVSGINGNFVTSKIVIKRGGQPTMYTVFFARHADGKWKIESM